MTANTIPVAFIKQFESEVKEAYQRKSSKLRGSVRTKTGVRGASVMFPKFGTGTAVQKPRNSPIPPMNPDHSSVEVFLSDYYAGDWVDKLDELKTNIPERQLLANAHAYALGRQTDALIVAALDGATTARNVTGTGDLADSAGITKAKILKGLEMLNANDVPDDGDRVGLVSPQGWTNMLGITEFVNSQYIGQTDLPFGGQGMEMKRWLGVVWLRYTGLSITSNIRTGFIYHKSAVAHAIQEDVTTDITWHGDRAAHWINAMMAMGAGLIDEAGLVRLKSTET